MTRSPEVSTEIGEMNTMKTIQASPPELLAAERMIGDEDLPVARTDIELSAPPDELQLVNGTPSARKIRLY